MDKEVYSLIFQAFDGTISADDFERLQDAIEKSDEVRDEYLRVVSLCQSLDEVAADQPQKGELKQVPDDRKPEFHSTQTTILKLVLAASVLFAVGSVAWWLGRRNVSSPTEEVAIQQFDESRAERTIAGYATLRRAADIQWASDRSSYLEGEVLPPGIFQFESGFVEIDFFCGATIVIEGPAKLDLESDWSVRLFNGRLRANVPPAARGFVVKAADSEIVDLGTEFALEVKSESETARLEVIDGEVMLRGGKLDGNHLLTGDSQWLKGDNGDEPTIKALSTSQDVHRRSELARNLRLEEWRASVKKLSADERLIVYYPMDAVQTDRVVRNAGLLGNQRDAVLVGMVDRVSGRFGAQSSGLAFIRAGSRARTRIDGEFKAFTFVCWTKINSLENRYNALFMSDGYETGELHWQIRDDGCLMFSVMVDDTVNIQRFDKTEQRNVKTAGMHHVYLSDSIWDVSRSGEWIHIAAVYDPASRRVEQFVNGDRVSSEEIIDKYFIDTLRIGASEIGNWGQPFRKSPWFAVRNLNGSIDELAIFNASLSAEEISDLYKQGKPLGY